jgi:hypothetical protein
MTAPPAPPGIVVAVFTDGRVDCISKTLTSFDALVTGPITRRLIFDDSGDPTYAQWLGERYPDWAIISAGRRRGFGGTIANAWPMMAGMPERYVCHLEDDFTFRRPVDLSRLAAVLDALPDLVQLSLMRQPWNDQERQAGSVVDALLARGLSFRPCSLYGARWLEHRGYFTTNPSLYPTKLCRLGWPDGDQSEGRFTARLLEDPALRFGIWGSGDPWVEHIGAERVGTGY